MFEFLLTEREERLPVGTDLAALEQIAAAVLGTILYPLFLTHF